MGSMFVYMGAMFLCQSDKVEPSAYLKVHMENGKVDGKSTSVTGLYRAFKYLGLSPNSGLIS